MSESDFQDILHHLYRNNEKQVAESILDLTCQSNKSSLHHLDFGQFPALQNTIPHRVSVHPIGSDVINFTNNYFNFPPELHFLTTVLEKVGSSSTCSVMDSDSCLSNNTDAAAADRRPTSDPEPVRELRQENFNIQTAIADMFKARGQNQGPVLNNTTFPTLPRDPFDRPCDVEAATQQFFCSEWLYGDSPGIHPYDDSTTNRDESSNATNSRSRARSRSRPAATDQREVVIHDDPLDLSDSNPYAECTYGQTRTYRRRAASARTKSRSRKPKLRSRSRTTRRKRATSTRDRDFDEEELDQVEVDEVLDEDDEVASEDEGGECVMVKPLLPGLRSRKMPIPHLRRKKRLLRPRTRSRYLLQKRRRTSTRAKLLSRPRFQQQQPRRSLLDLDRSRYHNDQEGIEGPAVPFLNDDDYHDDY